MWRPATGFRYRTTGELCGIVGIVGIVGNVGILEAVVEPERDIPPSVVPDAEIGITKPVAFPLWTNPFTVE